MVNIFKKSFWNIIGCAETVGLMLFQLYFGNISILPSNPFFSCWQWDCQEKTTNFPCWKSHFQLKYCLTVPLQHALAAQAKCFLKLGHISDSGRKPFIYSMRWSKVIISQKSLIDIALEEKFVFNLLFRLLFLAEIFHGYSIRTNIVNLQLFFYEI